VTITRRTTMASAVLLATGSFARLAQAQSLQPSPDWALAMPPRPDARLNITEEYARLVARDAYFWAWPMVNVFTRRFSSGHAPEPGLLGGVLPTAPLNHLAMLHDYIKPDQRLVASPNQDVIYGAALLALDISPVVVQVPDFGDRFWVYQVLDIRTDDFAQLGQMYGTTPGFYLLVGPSWRGFAPKGITKVFRATSQTGAVFPRVFQDNTPEDKQAVQAVIDAIDVYPLAEFDGTMKHHDWSKLPSFPAPEESGGGAIRWVSPDTIFDVLPAVLADAPPLPGEEAHYAQVSAVVEAARKNPMLKAAMVDEALKADKELVEPLLQFHNFGLQLPYQWSTVPNGAAFGTDYFTRTAVAKSNIFVNAPNETKYWYQDLDASGTRLNGANRYTVTFAKDQTPPARGFWSLTLYNQEHFFVPNQIDRYSLGTKNKDLVYNGDGSLTIYVQADAPSDAQRANWLPAPTSADFSLVIRAYWPKVAALDLSWTPPPVYKAK
jgi:hypothetical protein